MKEVHILGAGLSGMIALNAWPHARVFEKRPYSAEMAHKALLRFRSPAVGDALGIEFRKVRVHKGVWNGHAFVQPSILEANRYSEKVIGRLADRSIWNLDPVDRWIAPDDMMAQLLERMGNRIEWGHDVQALALERRAGIPVVSTIPMNVLMQVLDYHHSLSAPVEFKRAEIKVARWKIPGADVFQTVYNTDPRTGLYRVSITGDTLIAEAIGPVVWAQAFEPFGLAPAQCEMLGEVSQSYGKIAPIDEGVRRSFMLAATQEHNVFSLGRFATWRNILLDDVLHDVAVIKRLMATDAYGRSRHLHK